MKIPWENLIGQKILSVDTDFGRDIILLKLDDGREVVIDTEAIGCGLHRPVLLE